MSFRPLHDRVVVRRVDSEEKTAGGIIIPDTAKEKPSEGVIEAVGPGARDDAPRQYEIVGTGLRSLPPVNLRRWSARGIARLAAGRRGKRGPRTRAPGPWRARPAGAAPSPSPCPRRRRPPSGCRPPSPVRRPLRGPRPPPRRRRRRRG